MFELRAGLLLKSKNPLIYEVPSLTKGRVPSFLWYNKYYVWLKKEK